MFFIRHGETDWNVAKRIQGSTDIPLNDQGRQQARFLAERLKSEKISSAYSSPQKRAWETAEIATTHHQPLAILPVQELAEFGMGRFEGRPFPEVEKELDWDQLTSSDEYRASLGIETRASTKNWVETQLAELAQKHRGESILFSTHGGKKVHLLRSIFQHQPETIERLANLRLGNCSLTVIDWHVQAGPNLHLLNDTSHLSSD